MNEQVAKPEKITKPIQLLAAWLAGLFSIDSCFLIAAANLPNSPMLSGALVWAAILNVPLFLAAVFLLQTKFRPEMQEDQYYASYLSHKTNLRVTVNKDELQSAQLSHLTQRLVTLESSITSRLSKVASDAGFSGLLMGVNRCLSDGDVSITAALYAAGISSFRPFGDVEKPPSERVVAMSSQLASHLRVRIIDLARRLGFRYYAFIEPYEEIAEHVLWGAYGDADSYFEIAAEESCFQILEGGATSEGLKLKL